MTDPFVLAILGCPGAGKTTALKWLARASAGKALDMGQLIRDSAAQTDRLVQSSVAQGRLVSDELCIDLLQPHLANSVTPRVNVILSGFPRTQIQYSILQDICHREGISLYFLVLELGVEAARKRLVFRHEKNQRAGTVRCDDIAAIVEERFRVYEEVTLPLINHLLLTVPERIVRFNSYELKKKALFHELTKALPIDLDAVSSAQ